MLGRQSRKVHCNIIPPDLSTAMRIYKTSVRLPWSMNVRNTCIGRNVVCRGRPSCTHVWELCLHRPQVIMSKDILWKICCRICRSCCCTTVHCRWVWDAIAAHIPIGLHLTHRPAAHFWDKGKAGLRQRSKSCCMAICTYCIASCHLHGSQFLPGVVAGTLRSAEGGLHSHIQCHRRWEGRGSFGRVERPSAPVRL